MPTPNKIGSKWYGKVPVGVVGRDKWDRQDASASWTDGGEVKRIVEAIVPVLEQLVAKEALGAVSDFASTGEAAVQAGDKGEVMVGVRLISEQAAMIVAIPLRKLLIAALTEVRNGIALDPQAQALLSDLVALGRQLATLGQPPSQNKVIKTQPAVNGGAH